MPARYPRPAADEAHPYFQRYVAEAINGDVLAELALTRTHLVDLITSMDEDRALHRYAPGKWSVKEVVQHLVDTERIFASRALAFARGDVAPMPGFDENAYAEASRADERPLGDILEEHAAVRRASIALFQGLPADAVLRRGTADGKEFTVRAIPWIIVGHEIHHLSVLRERYLS